MGGDGGGGTREKKFSRTQGVAVGVELTFNGRNGGMRWNLGSCDFSDQYYITTFVAGAVQCRCVPTSSTTLQDKRYLGIYVAMYFTICRLWIDT